MTLGKLNVKKIEALADGTKNGHVKLSIPKALIMLKLQPVGLIQEL